MSSDKTSIADIEPFTRTGAIMKSTFLLIVLSFILTGCNPTVRIEAPDKPIEINLNVKIEHEIRLQVDKELEGLFGDESDVF